MVFLILMGTSNKVHASLEQYFCVPTGWISASDLEFDAPPASREFNEHISRGAGDGRGFLLKLNARRKTAEMLIKEKVNGVEKETISEGSITLTTDSVINLALDDAASKNYGYDGNGNSRLVSIILMREQNKYMLSAITVVGDEYGMSFVAGGKCTKL